MAYTITEAASGALAGSLDTVAVAEVAVALLTIQVGDSGGLIDQAQVPTGNALVGTDVLQLLEPSPADIGTTDADAFSGTETAQGVLPTVAIDSGGVGELATVATKVANAITDTDGMRVAEVITTILPTVTAEAMAMADAIQTLLDSLNTEPITVAEFGGPSFGLVSFVGSPRGHADLVPSALGLMDAVPSLSGTGDII